MSIQINVNFEHPYFTEVLRFQLKWDFPFLPRVGENLNPRIWIEGDVLDRSYIETQLTKEGEESLKAYKHSLEDWLYEAGMGNGRIFDISYRKKKDNPYDIYVEIYINKSGTF